MATYYARNVTGNWAANTSWDSASSGGAGPAGPPVAGDTAIFDSGFTGSITAAASASCATLTVQAGATGTLTINAAYNINVSAGVTLVTGFNLGGTGTLRLSGTSTFTTAGLTIPWHIYLASATMAITLVGHLITTGTIIIGAAVRFTGAYNITCASLNFSGQWSLSYYLYYDSGTTLTITTSVYISSNPLYQVIVKGYTASAVAYLNYSGTAENCCVQGVVFTDVDASGSAQVIDNWNGGTLTRCTNIENKTSANLALASDALKILTGQTVGGVAGSASAGGVYMPRARQIGV